MVCIDQKQHLKTVKTTSQNMSNPKTFDIMGCIDQKQHLKTVKNNTSKHVKSQNLRYNGLYRLKTAENEHRKMTSKHKTFDIMVCID